jgi:hypothetical protein
MTNRNIPIIDWIEDTYPKLFKELKDYAEKSNLFDQKKTIYIQDYTMIVGIMLGYLKKNYGIDSGICEDDIKTAFKRANIIYKHKNK